jgi:hypothetical protein
MLHPDIRLVWKDDKVGYGLYASAKIPAGIMVYVQDALDIVIPPDSPLLQDPLYAAWIDKYCIIDGQGNRIVAWDSSKYANHCCHYNTLATSYGFEIAIQDIAAGEEITCDYLIFNLEEDMPLACRFEDCRKVLHPQDFERWAPTWDMQIRRALQSFQRHPQPLLAYLPAEYYQPLLNYLSTGEGYRPVSLLRYKPSGN